MPKIVAVAVVRMGSSRLPGKMMMPIAGKPLVGHLLGRLGQSKHINEIVVATSVNPLDDVIEAYCNEAGFPCFRGSEDDVLGRMIGALTSRDADIGVEAYGDGPVIDPAIVDRVIETFIAAEGDYDLVGNDMKTTYPPGMDVEAFSVPALVDAGERTDDPEIREHGTAFIRFNPDIYNVLNITAPPHHHRPEVEVEVDTEEDFHVISAVIEHFAPRADFTLDEILAFLDENPAIQELNRDTPRRWKQYRENDDG